MPGNVSGALLSFIATLDFLTLFLNMIRSLCKVFLKISFLFVGACIFEIGDNSVVAKEEPPLKFYVTQAALPNPNLKFIENTAREIEKAIYPRKLEFKILGIQEIEQRIVDKSVDLVIAGAGRYRNNLLYGLRDIATIITPQQPNPNAAVGSLIVVSKENENINSLKDLKGKTIAINNPLGFQGILIVLNELYKNGFDPENFFGNYIVVGMEQLPGLDLVRERKADAAIINSCLAEVSFEDGRDILQGLKVINPKESKEIRCQVSTEVYPHWSLMITPHLDVPTLNKILNVIHSPSIPEFSGFKWGLATDYSRVDELYKNLKLGLYSYLREWTVKRIWEELRYWILAVVLGFIALAGHSVLVSHLVKVRTAQLQKSLQRQKALSLKNKKIQEALEKENRVEGISLFARILAHELAQPIGAIFLYTEGIGNLLNKKGTCTEADKGLIISSLKKLEKRADKAQSIINNLRGYIRGEKREVRPINVGLVCQKTVLDFKELESVTGETISLSTPRHPVFIQGNSLDLEVILLNLLKNAIEACRSAEVEPKIMVRLRETETENCILEVEDNAKNFPAELTKRSSQTFFSTAAKGLGLGLSIIRSLVSSYDGSFSFEENSKGNLVAKVVIPLAKERK